MSKPTFEQLITAFDNLVHELEKSKEAPKQEAQLKEPTEATPSPECDGNCDSCEYAEDNDSVSIMPPLELLISNRINKHIEEGTFPSLEEAQTIHILDSINYRYNR